MALLFAALIELVTVVCAAGIAFAGMMRTTGATDEDGRSARWVFICGTVIAALVAGSHWVGW